MTVTATPAPGAGAGTGAANSVGGVIRRLDRWQQRTKVPAFAFGVVKKFGDDRAGSLAGLMAYYGFLAMFPLLLAMTTVLGFVFHSNPSVQQRVMHSALRDFPIIGNQLGQSIRPLHGNGFGLVVGLVGLLYGSLGVTQIGQFAMAQVWNIPGVARPNFVTRVARGLALLVVIGGGVIVTTVLASLPAVGSVPG